MTNIILQDQNGDFLETLQVKHFERFILYRGYLFEMVSDGVFEQRGYLELY